MLERTGRNGSRQRRLPASSVVWLVIAIGLWGDRDIPALWRQVAGTLHDLLQAAGFGKRPPGKSALSKARSRLGARPLRQLFLAVSRPGTAHDARGLLSRNNRDSLRLKGTMLSGLSGFVCVADATEYNSGINSFSLCG